MQNFSRAVVSAATSNRRQLLTSVSSNCIKSVQVQTGIRGFANRFVRWSSSSRLVDNNSLLQGETRGLDVNNEKSREIGGPNNRRIDDFSPNNVTVTDKSPLINANQEERPMESKAEKINENRTNDQKTSTPKPRHDPYPICHAEGSAEQVQAAKVFSKLGLSSSLITYMSTRFDHPTPIQEMSIPLLLKGSSALMTSQTGSGKTLSYMLPLIVRMQASEQKRKEQPDVKHKDGPRVVVLSPTRELTAQVISQARSISHFAKFRARAWGNNEKQKKREKDVVPDLVVSSPSAFVREMKLYNWSTIESLVLDECDALLFRDSGFVEEIEDITSRIGKKVQIVCVGATALKSEARRWLEKHRPEAEIIKAEGAGDLPSNIKVHMVSVKEEEGYNKHPALERALAPFLSFPKRDKKDTYAPRCIVFCNSVASCRSTAHTLEEKYADIAECYCLHGEMKPNQREENFTMFVNESPLATTKDSNDLSQSGIGTKKKLKILVCTDLSSRGIDVRNVQHVVIFDLPNNILDFLHRAGRTGRAGQAGEVTFIVGRGEKNKLVEVLEKGRQQKKSEKDTSRSFDRR